MKDPITIPETIVIIKKTISVKIDILNHKEIVKHHKGKFFGTLINWFGFEQAKKEIKAGVIKDLNENLKNRIEEQIDTELSSRLSKEVSQKITEELQKNKIKAIVITEIK
jgi:hypothetical protein